MNNGSVVNTERRKSFQETRGFTLPNNMMRIYRIFREYLEKEKVGLEFDSNYLSITVFELHITSKILRRQIYSETVNLEEIEVFAFFRELYRRSNRSFPISEVPK